MLVHAEAKSCTRTDATSGRSVSAVRRRQSVDRNSGVGASLRLYFHSQSTTAQRQTNVSESNVGGRHSNVGGRSRSVSSRSPPAQQVRQSATHSGSGSWRHGTSTTNSSVVAGKELEKTCALKTADGRHVTDGGVDSTGGLSPSTAGKHGRNTSSRGTVDDAADVTTHGRSSYVQRMSASQRRVGDDAIRLHCRLKSPSTGVTSLLSRDNDVSPLDGDITQCQVGSRDTSMSLVCSCRPGCLASLLASC